MVGLPTGHGYAPLSRIKDLEDNVKKNPYVGNNTFPIARQTYLLRAATERWLSLESAMTEPWLSLTEDSFSVGLGLGLGFSLVAGHESGAGVFQQARQDNRKSNG